MGVKTNIAWADATWNPWVGCTRVSEACDHCYMAREQTRYGNDPWTLRRTSRSTFRLPLAKRRDGSWRIPAGSRVFVCSWSDFFHESVTNDWRQEAVDIMAERPDLTFLLLTKRPQEMRRWANSIEDQSRETCGHIWLGVTAENQARADERIPELLGFNWPGKRFVSIEPMLGPVDLRPWLRCVAPGVPPVSLLDWVIAGGESGPEARPTHPDWVRALRDQCREAGVPFFFKQWGEWAPCVDESRYTHGEAETSRNAQGWLALDGRFGHCWITDDGGTWQNWTGDPRGVEKGGADIAIVNNVGRERAGRLLDGREWLEFPKEGR